MPYFLKVNNIWASFFAWKCSNDQKTFSHTQE